MSVCPSVCLSVCLSVTLRYCIKTKKASVMISSASESPTILVSRNIWFITKLERSHLERGRLMRLEWVKIDNILAIFRPITKRCKIGPRLILITNRKSHTRFRLVPKSTTLGECDPELTLKRYYALCCITHVFRSPPQKMN